VKRIRVGVIYGGKSGEHEVSVASAASIFRHLDRARYDAVPLFIQKDGHWTLGASAPQVLSAGEVLRQHAAQALQPVEPSAAVGSSDVDVVFPVLHGPYGEDGTVQGLLELANVPYVGAGVLGSAVGMDKAVMKTLFAAQGLPIVPHLVVRQPEWERSRSAVVRRVAGGLGYPVFVKPANLGSSVGVSKATSESGLGEALATAFEFDRKAVVEAAVPKAREIECAVLGNEDPEASVPGEIVPWGDFYDYKAKYLEDRSRLLIPAPLDEGQTEHIRQLAIQAFGAVEGAGMARVDFLMAGDTGDIFVNEVNTIPGFTTISMYPKLWEASGLSYPALLDRLIALAFERHAGKQRLRTSIA
jgi:D-alanine-D-alanine ligase